MIIFYQIVVPPLPGKALKRQLPFRGDEGLFEESFIEERRMGLELFINRSINAPDLLTNAYSRTFKLKRPKNRTSLAEKVTQKPVVPSSILRDAKPALIFKMWVILYMKWKKKTGMCVVIIGLMCGVVESHTKWCLALDLWEKVWCKRASRFERALKDRVFPIHSSIFNTACLSWTGLRAMSHLRKKLKKCKVFTAKQNLLTCYSPMSTGNYKNQTRVPEYRFHFIHNYITKVQICYSNRLSHIKTIIQLYSSTSVPSYILPCCVCSSLELQVTLWPRMSAVCTCSCRSPRSTGTTFPEKYDTRFTGGRGWRVVGL